MHSTNNIERFKQRLRDGKVCVGTSVQLTDSLELEFDFATAWDELRQGAASMTR